MSGRLLNPDGKVLVVESNSASRNILVEVVKEFGFQDVEGIDTVKAALGYLEVERCSWVVAPFIPDEPVTALHLLGIFAKYEILSRTRLSLLVETPEMSVLPRAYELGLLSHHTRPFTKETLKQDFSLLFERFERTHQNDVLTSAFFLTDYLRDNGLHKSMMSLHQKLFELYPDAAEPLLFLAEACFLNNRYDEGKAILGRAQVLEVKGWEDIASRFIRADDSVPPELGIKKCVIVDSDDAVANKLTELLKKVTAGQIVCFSKPQDALTWCESNKDVDLVLQEWRLPGIAGPYFLQRLRGLMPADLPIVIVSSLVTKQDLPLLSEMGVANVIEKPIRENEFNAAISKTLQQEQNPTQPDSLERKIHQFLTLGDTERALRLRARIDGDVTFSSGLKGYIAALFAFYDKKYSEAKALLMEAIQRGADQVKAFNLLGRTLANLKDLAGACKCLMKAQELSPRNIERLCEIAAAQREMEQDSAAATTIENAKSQDAGNDKVQKEETKQAIKSGDTERAKALMKKAATPGVVVSEMNNTAVGYIAGNNFERAKSLYEKTILAIPEENMALRTRVVYNLGLAYAREGVLEKAKETLAQVPNDSSLPIAKKASSLLKKVTAALQSGEKLDLKAVEVDKADAIDVDALNDKANAKKVEEIQTSDESGGTQVVKVAIATAKAGDICCYKIFNNEESIDPRWVEMLKNKPNFKLRAAIERGEAMGVEKGMK